jgi:hypothetical protein
MEKTTIPPSRCGDYTSVDGLNMIYCGLDRGHAAKSHEARITGVWKGETIVLNWESV